MSVEPLPRVADLIPHAGPAVLLERVARWHDHTVECTGVIHPDCPYVRRGVVFTVATIEHMAQACAVLMGLRARLRRSKVSGGLLLGVRTAALHRGSIPVGTELRVHATHVWGDDDLATFDCRVDAEGVPTAEATLNVLKTETPESC